MGTPVYVTFSPYLIRSDIAISYALPS
jgi:hypothetical protein